jgi:hypothetical protein
MNNKDKETLTRAVEILSSVFPAGNDKIKRMRKQVNIWRLEDEMNEVEEAISTIKRFRDNKITEFDGLYTDLNCEGGEQ